MCRPPFVSVFKMSFFRFAIDLCYRLMCVGVYKTTTAHGRRFEFNPKFLQNQIFVSAVFFRRAFILWISVPWMQCLCSFFISDIHLPTVKKKREHAVTQWLRHCGTNRKVAGSIPDGVIGIFHRHNPSGRTMALGSTQPLTEMSTRNISWE
jgi:hypothetical protein